MASILDTLFPKQDYRTAAPSGGYADLYANGLLGSRTDTPTSVGAMETGKDFIPGIGDAIALKEAYDAASRGDKVAAGLLTAGAALGLIPGAGDAVARPVMAAGRKAADVASRIEVDPNAVGSLLGNVRMKPKGEAKQSVAEMRRQANIDRFGFDPNEASAAQPSAGLLSDYAGEHRAPMRDGNAPAFNLAGDIYPDDIYSSNAVQYYGTGNTSMDRETMGLLQSLRGQPDAEVTIYRATPKGVKDLNAGDWVTVSKQYAQDHGEAALGGDFEIIERKVKAGEIFTNGDSIHEFGYDPSSPAQKIADLLSSGRADDVTDEMLSKLTAQDNSELFDLYQSGATGMDLPMDEASRMARAEAAGFDVNKSLYHGTNSDINGFSGNVFSSDNPTLASTYNKGLEGAGIYPIMAKSKLGDTLVEGGGAGWSQLNVSDVKDPAVAEWLDWAEGQKISTREIETAASREGRSGVQFKDIVDTGAGFNSNKFKNLGYTKEQERALQKQYMEDLSKPSNVDVRLSPNLVRSKFARFDPRLASLKNLSAGVGVAPIGLLALREEQKRANEEQYKRGLLQ
jgi:hypothetical protein